MRFIQGNTLAVLGLLSSLSLNACFDDSSSENDNPNLPALPAHWKQQIQTSQAVDENPADDIVEVTLTAEETELELVPGIKTKVWTYNGSIPGPTINAKVGDTLIVHFVNNLPADPDLNDDIVYTSTIHWHGLELPAIMDGSSISHPAIAPQGGTKRYEFKLLNAATYWYHPHKSSRVQIEKGLYGALIVRDPEQDQRLQLPKDELVLVLDDVLLNNQGQIDMEYPSDPAARALMQLNGREGNWMLLNGKGVKVRTEDTETNPGPPVEAPNIPVVQVRSGVPIRLRIINAANSRFMRFALREQSLYRIGGDGGLLEYPIEAPPIPTILAANQKPGLQARHGLNNELQSDPDINKGILLTPGERADVVFTPIGAPGSDMFLDWHDFHRGLHTVTTNDQAELMVGHSDKDGFRLDYGLIRFVFTDDSDDTTSAYQLPKQLRTITRHDYNNVETLQVTFGHMLPDDKGDVTFFAKMQDNRGIPFGKLTEETALTAYVGKTYIWEVINLTAGDHPFHPHGFTFQVIDYQYIDLDNLANERIEIPGHLENKDTLRIPRRPGARGRSRTIARLAVTFDDSGREGQVIAFGKQPTSSQSGGWLVHCHVLEHADRGMLTYLRLLENP